MSRVPSSARLPQVGCPTDEMPCLGNSKECRHSRNLNPTLSFEEASRVLVYALCTLDIRSEPECTRAVARRMHLCLMFTKFNHNDDTDLGSDFAAVRNKLVVVVPAGAAIQHDDKCQ